jgi:hypothetical protein
VVKNKVAAPFKQAEFDIMYNSGISREGELIDLAVEKEIIKKSGTWLSFGEDRLGQGRENARVFLAEHPDVRAAIEAEIRRRAGVEMAAAGAANAGAAALGAVVPPGRDGGTSGDAVGRKALGDGSGQASTRGDGAGQVAVANRGMAAAGGIARTGPKAPFGRAQAADGRGSGARTAVATRRGKS